MKTETIDRLPSPRLCRTWLATSTSWESGLKSERIEFKNPTGYYGASRYARRKWGACEVVPA